MHDAARDGDSSELALQQIENLPAPRSCWPDRGVLSRERRQIMRLCEAYLSADNFNVLWLRDVHELSFAEISQVTFQTPDAARAMYHRTIDRMRELLASVGYTVLEYQQNKPIWGYTLKLRAPRGVTKLQDLI